MLMNDQKIKFPEQLNEAERLEFLNYLLQTLQSISSQSNQDSHLSKEKVGDDRILFPILS